MTSSPKPPGMTWVSPYFAVSDVDRMIEFYEKAFNFEKKELSPGEDGTTWHAEMKYKDQVLMFGKQDVYQNQAHSPATSGIDSPINLYLYCEDVDAFHKAAVIAGAHSLSVPADMFWGDRMCRLMDPEGYVWCFATHINKHK